MKYFVDENNVIFAYEDDGSQDEFIGDKTPITEQEVNAILNPPLTTEQLTAQAEQQKTSLRTQADYEIAWRQDAVDAEIATGDETTDLALWKKYRVLVMRIDTATAPDIEWPTPPDQAS